MRRREIRWRPSYLLSGDSDDTVHVSGHVPRQNDRNVSVDHLGKVTDLHQTQQTFTTVQTDGV